VAPQHKEASSQQRKDRKLRVDVSWL